LPEAQRVYRVKVVETFQRTGMPIEKLEVFRELLEENAFQLSDSRHALDFFYH